MRVVAYDPFVARRALPRARRRAGATLDDVLAARRLPHPAPAADRRDARRRSTPRRSRRCATACGSSTPRAASCVDEDALVEALRSGKLAGAALDVFSAEPYSGPLLELDNVVVTPHLAASTEEAQDRAGVIVAEQVVGRARGRPRHERGQHPVDRRRGPRGARPVHPARGEARAARDGARAAAAPTRIALDVLRRARRVRHAPADGRRAERRLPGPGRPAGQLRQRAGRSRPSAGSRSSRSGAARSRDFTNLIARRAPTASARRRDDDRPRRPRTGSSRALGFEIEIELAPLMVFFRYDDVPGVIGRVGTLFGEAGVNIANMAVSRTPRGGQGADGASRSTRPRRRSSSSASTRRASTTPGSSRSPSSERAAGRPSRPSRSRPRPRRPARLDSRRAPA